MIQKLRNSPGLFSVDEICNWFINRGVPLQDAEDLAVEVALKLHSAHQTDGEKQGLLASTRRSVLIDWIRSENKGYRQVQRKVRKIVIESDEVETLALEKLLFAYVGIALRKIVTLLESFVTSEMLAKLSEKGYMTPQIIRRDQHLKELIIHVLCFTQSAIECKELARWISKVCEVPLSLKVMSADEGEDQHDFQSAAVDSALSPEEQAIVEETFDTFRDFILTNQVSVLQFVAVIGLMSKEFLTSELRLSKSEISRKLQSSGVEANSFWEGLPFESDETLANVLRLHELAPRERANRISGARMQILKRSWPAQFKKQMRCKPELRIPL
jgi:hypothetical protein